jgi:hypothetical protein
MKVTWCTASLALVPSLVAAAEVELVLREASASSA